MVIHISGCHTTRTQPCAEIVRDSAADKLLQKVSLAPPFDKGAVGRINGVKVKMKFPQFINVICNRCLQSQSQSSKSSQVKLSTSTPGRLLIRSQSQSGSGSRGHGHGLVAFPIPSDTTINQVMFMCVKNES